MCAQQSSCAFVNHFILGHFWKYGIQLINIGSVFTTVPKFSVCHNLEHGIYAHHFSVKPALAAAREAAKFVPLGEKKYGASSARDAEETRNAWSQYGANWSTDNSRVVDNNFGIGQCMHMTLLFSQRRSQEVVTIGRKTARVRAKDFSRRHK